MNPMQNNNRYSARNAASTPRKGRSAAGALVGVWVAAAFLFSVGGAATVIGVLVVIGAVTGFIIWAAKSAAGSPRANPGRPGGTAPAPIRPMQPQPYRAAADGHLCDPGQHEEEHRSNEALNEMERGYADDNGRRFAPQGYPNSAPGNREGRMTREEYQKKTRELRSLLDAGILSQEEYRAKMSEYSRFVR